MCGILKKISHVVLPHLGAVGGFADGLIQGGGVKGALHEGLNSGIEAAGQIGGSMIGSAILPQTIGSFIGSSATNAIGSSIADKSLGSVIGGYAGNALADNYISKQQPTATDASPAPDPNSLLPAAFSPKQSPSLQLPGSLSGLNGMDQNQQTSNLATQGVYGGGLGPEEQDYFKGLVNNQLVDPSGKTADIGSLSPIENSYLSQLGFGGYSNSKDLLGALSKWKQQAA